MFVQLLNQNATNIPEKTRRFMAFQVSVTHWFLLTPFFHRAEVVSQGRREGSRRGRVGAGEWSRKEIHGGPGTGAKGGEWDPGGRG